MRQVVWDRANDGGGQMLHGLKNILQTRLSIIGQDYLEDTSVSFVGSFVQKRR
jgi:hypothetical protein